MTRILLFLFMACVACNNSSDTSKDDTQKNPARNMASNWTKEDENEFLSGCIENAKEKFREDTAYSYCNCVLAKVKQHFPTADSAAAELKDSLSAAAFTKDCQ